MGEDTKGSEESLRGNGPPGEEEFDPLKTELHHLLVGRFQAVYTIPREIEPR
jgi:hypothetical protein